MLDHDLNRRLSEALRVEPAPDQLARLQSFWQTQSRTDRRRRRLRLATTFAAALLFTIAADFWLGAVDPPRPQNLIADKPPVTEEPQQLAEVPSSPAPIPHSPLPIPSRSRGRAPTDYERLAFALQSRQPTPLRPSPLSAAVDAALDRLAAYPAELDHAAESLAAAPPRAVEQQLLDRWSLADGRRRRSILRLLGEYGSSRSAPHLLRAASQPLLQADALAAIERLGGLSALAAACAQTTDPALRQTIAQRLLAADSEEAIDCFLQLAAHPALAPDLLAAADAHPNAPTARLFNLLNAEDKRTRQTAALILGRINGPEVTAQLIAIVTADPGAGEAWLALINCRGESAHQFLASASYNPHMLGHLNHARLTSAQMLQ